MSWSRVPARHRRQPLPRSRTNHAPTDQTHATVQTNVSSRCPSRGFRRYLIIPGKCHFLDIWGFPGEILGTFDAIFNYVRQMSRHLIYFFEANVIFRCRDIYGNPNVDGAASPGSTRGQKVPSAASRCMASMAAAAGSSSSAVDSCAMDSTHVTLWSMAARHSRSGPHLHCMQVPRTASTAAASPNASGQRVGSRRCTQHSSQRRRM